MVVNDSDRRADDVADLFRAEQAVTGGDSPARVGVLPERLLVQQHQLASPSRLICPSTYPLGFGAGLGSEGLGV